MIAPAPIIDLRDQLLRGGKPSTRSHLDVYGVVVHHTAGSLPPEAVARYHVRSRGWDSVGYHFWIDPDGRVFQLNNVLEITNSQGGQGSRAPVPFARPNENFLAIVFRGDFTQEEPTQAAKVAFRWLWATLQRELPIGPDMLFAHKDFKDTLCPGVLADLVDDVLLNVGRIRDLMPRTYEAAQRALVTLGYDLGSYGPLGDGVDGDWGSVSRGALAHLLGQGELDFVSSYGLAEELHEKAVDISVS